MFLWWGPELIQFYNDAYRPSLGDNGKHPTAVGQKGPDCWPEIWPIIKPLIDQVLGGGEAIWHEEQLIPIYRNGKLEDVYWTFGYSAVKDESGQPAGVLVICTETTQAVIARLKLEEAEVGLRGAVELAQLGTWSIDVTTQGLIFSDRLIKWFGYDPEAQSYTEVIPILEAGDQERVNQAVAWALNPESNGIYNEVYTVIHPKTGQKRILHAQGKTVFDATGKAVRMNGTAQDITIQWELQMALENEVQQRTEELAASHDELVAKNKAYAAINEELEKANRLLNQSNESLQKFAYVASHDLQEPLRKIQQFGDILKSQHQEGLGNGVDYLERMQLAANRMSLLIRDLLNYSRMSIHRDMDVSVSLHEVVNRSLTDLDLVIAETGAQINVEPLPTIWGNSSQLGQLFLNLLSNALKFRQPDMAPQIDIRSELVAAGNLPLSVKPTQVAPAYHLIELADNGIGFDEHQVDRIFEVFQRLHGKNQFAGTGIGLAICEKVAINHGGAITARSQPGQGATFSVYLPVWQANQATD